MGTKTISNGGAGAKTATLKVFGWQYTLLLAALAFCLLGNLAATAAILGGSGPSTIEFGKIFSHSFNIDENASPEQIRAQTNENISRIFEDTRENMLPHTLYDWIVKLAVVPATLALTAAYCFWFYRARLNLGVLEVEGARYSPGFAVLANVIPVANLFLPYLVLTEIWKASAPRSDKAWQAGKGSRIIDAWLVLRLAAAIGGVWSAVTIFLSRGPHQAAALISATLLACEYIVAMIIVRSIDSRQAVRFSAIQG